MVYFENRPNKYLWIIVFNYLSPYLGLPDQGILDKIHKCHESLRRNHGWLDDNMSQDVEKDHHFSEASLEIHQTSSGSRRRQGMTKKLSLISKKIEELAQPQSNFTSTSGNRTSVDYSRFEDSTGCTTAESPQLPAAYTRKSIICFNQATNYRGMGNKERVRRVPDIDRILNSDQVEQLEKLMREVQSEEERTLRFGKFLSFL